MLTNKTFSLLLSAATALVLNVLPAQADNYLPGLLVVLSVLRA